MTAQLPLPKSADEFTSWMQAEPFIQDLLARTITLATLDSWLADWTRLARLVLETYQRLYVATTVDTEDQESERRYYTFLEDIFPAWQAAEQNKVVWVLVILFMPLVRSILYFAAIRPKVRAGGTS